MQYIFDFVSTQLDSAVGSGWRWFSVLNRDEWIIVLAVGCVLGFLCMRGYGSRSNF